MPDGRRLGEHGVDALRLGAADLVLTGRPRVADDGDPVADHPVEDGLEAGAGRRLVDDVGRVGQRREQHRDVDVEQHLGLAGPGAPAPPAISTVLRPGSGVLAVELARATKSSTSLRWKLSKATMPSFCAFVVSARRRAGRPGLGSRPASMYSRHAGLERHTLGSIRKLQVSAEPVRPAAEPDARQILEDRQVGEV